MEQNNDLLLADRVELEMLQEIARMKAHGAVLLPQQDELARRYRVSLRTIRTVTNRLKERNLVRSIKGKGVFLVDGPKDSGKILLVVDNPAHQYTSMVLGVANRVLLERGLDPVLATTDNFNRVGGDLRGVLLINRCAGIEEFLAARNLPACAINDVMELKRRQSVYVQTVRCNNYLWAYLATTLLLRRGFTEALFFSSQGGSEIEHDRFCGFRDAITDSGGSPNADCFVDVPLANCTELDAFCRRERARLQQLVEAHPGRVGAVDFSGTMTFPNSVFFHRIIDNLLDGERIVIAEYQENPRVFYAKAVVMQSMTDLVSRALDLVLQRAQAFSLCETHDRLRVLLNEEGVWQERAWPQLFGATAMQGTLTSRKN